MNEIKKKWNRLRNRSRRNISECCSLEEFQKWYVAQVKVCSYCGIEEEFLRDYCTRSHSTACLHVDRVNNRRGYLPDNMTLACYNCNSIIKRTRTEDFVKVVVEAILVNEMLDEYHLWNVPIEKREAACFWHQFTKGRSTLKGDREVYVYETPNTLHYLPDHQATQEKDEKSSRQMGE